VINKWLHDNPGEWILIRAVVLYGDPCWIDGADKGLLRLARLADQVGCSSAKTYPYPAPAGVLQVPFLTQSWCAYHDPVCGGGYRSSLKNQPRNAYNCRNTTCPHNQYRVGYRGEGALKSGAQFVVQQLVG
jgi:hypothetical protein